MFIDKNEFKLMLKEAMFGALMEAHDAISSKKPSSKAVILGKPGEAIVQDAINGAIQPSKEPVQQPVKAESLGAPEHMPQGEPKKRGRPAKVKEEVVEEQKAEEPKVEAPKDESLTYEVMMDKIRSAIDESGDEDGAAKARTFCQKQFNVAKFKELVPAQFVDAVAGVRTALGLK